MFTSDKHLLFVLFIVSHMITSAKEVLVLVPFVQDQDYAKNAWQNVTKLVMCSMSH